MTDSSRIHIVGRDFDEEVRQDRARRIDALSVDRSLVPPASALPPPPVEGQDREQTNAAIRAAATMSDRMAAWRRLAR